PLGAVEVRMAEAVGLELLPERQRGCPSLFLDVVTCGHAQREVLDLDLEGLGTPAEQPHRGIVAEPADEAVGTISPARTGCDRPRAARPRGTRRRSAPARRRAGARGTPRRTRPAPARPRRARRRSGSGSAPRPRTAPRAEICPPPRKPGRPTGRASRAAPA